MRIGIDCRALRAQNLYGIGTYSLHLIQALIQSDGAHEWIPITDPGSLPRHLNGSRLDLCHILERTPPSIAMDRTVATVYDLIPLIFPRVYIPWYRRSGWTLKAYFRFLRRLPRIIAVSSQTQSDLVRLLGIPPSRIQVIYPGIGPAFRVINDPNRIQAAIARYRIRSPFFLYVGTCDYRKNLPGLLKAFASFTREGFGEFRLVLVGDGVGRPAEALRRMARGLGVDRSVDLVGFIPVEDLACLYNAASGFVFPSFYEGFGLPPVEAMACGTPVLTSNNSSLSEVAGDAALLVDPHDGKALAHGMRRLAQDDLLRETLIEHGIRRARRFTWEEAARQTLRVYEALT